jgi:hypothetical protein
VVESNRLDCSGGAGATEAAPRAGRSPAADKTNIVQFSIEQIILKLNWLK